VPAKDAIVVVLKRLSCSIIGQKRSRTSSRLSLLLRAP